MIIDIKVLNVHYSIKAPVFYGLLYQALMQHCAASSCTKMQLAKKTWLAHDMLSKPCSSIKSSYGALTCLVLPPGTWSDFDDETFGAVQWSHDESVLPEKVKAALENRQAGDQSQAPLPDATANQQQQVGARLVCCVMYHPEILFPCALFKPKLAESTLCRTEHSTAQEACVLCRGERSPEKESQ